MSRYLQRGPNLGWANVRRAAGNQPALVAARFAQRGTRLTQFGHTETKAYHVNLIRDGYEAASAQEFAQLIEPSYADRFRQITWDRIHGLIRHDASLARLRTYLETKTAGLAKAFQEY